MDRKVFISALLFSEVCWFRTNEHFAFTPLINDFYRVVFFFYSIPFTIFAIVITWHLKVWQKQKNRSCSCSEYSCYNRTLSQMWSKRTKRKTKVCFSKKSSIQNRTITLQIDVAVWIWRFFFSKMPMILAVLMFYKIHIKAVLST